MTEAIITLDTINPIEFFGVNNNKFNLLKKRFPLLKVLSRGKQIKLAGQPEEVIEAKEKIELILKFLEKNGHLSEQYFSQILGDEEEMNEEQEVPDLTNGNDILVFGRNGRIIKARTRNQQMMASASEKNDILFAVGPAGTRKTYTAVPWLSGH